MRASIQPHEEITVNTTSNDFAKQGQDFADKTADKVQSGIRDARQTATKVGDKLSSDMEGNRFRCEGRRTYRGATMTPTELLAADGINYVQTLIEHAGCARRQEAA